MPNTINFPADIGDTVYFYDKETSLIYPMVVYNITKNRLGDFKYILVSADSNWDNQYAEVVNINDFGKIWFSNVNQAEDYAKSDIDLASLSTALFKTSQIFNHLQYKRIILLESNTLIKFKSYDFLNKVIIFTDDLGNQHNVNILELQSKIQFK